MTIRYGIRWDGRGRPKVALAVGLAAIALALWREGIAVFAAAGNNGDFSSRSTLRTPAARLLSAHAELTPDQLKALLAAGAVDLPDPRSADGAGRADMAGSLAAPVPSLAAARQGWLPAILDRRTMERALRRGQVHGPGGEWSGRRWSGRRWSGDSWVDSGI